MHEPAAASFKDAWCVKTCDYAALISRVLQCVAVCGSACCSDYEASISRGLWFVAVYVAVIPRLGLPV